MLMRLLMALLVACLALPAAAMPLAMADRHEVDAPAQDCHGKAAGQKAPGKARTAKHECIGCIVPALSLPREPAAIRLTGLLSPAAGAVVPAPLAAAPEPPPPRS